MRGGFVTDVYSFELDGAPPGWSGKLVLRIYPDYANVLDVVRERCAREVVAAQGGPAPRVLAFERKRDELGGAFMVMEFLEGRPQMVIEFPQIVLEVPRLFTLPRRHAKAMNLVHSLDAQPLIERFAANGIDRRAAGPDNWLDRAEEWMVRWDLDGLRPALDWLRTNRPDEPSRPSICHGDLFGANIRERRGHVTGIIDWSLTSVGDPAYDIGGQLAAYEMSATPGPYVFQALSIAFGRVLAWGFRASYRRYRRIPRETVRYYSVYRAFIEMTFKLGTMAETQATGVVRRMPTWRPGQCARYIRRRTGVRVVI